MAKIANPRKQFQFNVLIPGINAFLIQELDLPDIELDQVVHGDVNYEVKTGGMKKVSNMRISKISESLGDNGFLWTWVESIQSTVVGGGELPSLYKRDIIIEEYANDGISVAARFLLTGCWPQKINGITFRRTGSDNTIENVEFSVDNMRRI